MDMVVDAAVTDAVRMQGVSKSFDGVHALRNVDFRVQRGEIHALLGENGAGKSTILKILNGVYSPDEGTIEVGGAPLIENSPEASRRAGISMIFQEMSLVPTLTVAQNIFLNREMRSGGLIDDRAAERRARTLFAELGVDIDPRLLVSELSAGQQQLTEIVKATSRDARVLILDEPSTALSGSETERLFAFLARLKAEGVAVVYVSHRMDEIFKIADTATILRDGQHVVTAPIATFTLQSMIEQIVGRRAGGFHEPEQIAQGEPLLEMRGVSGARRPRRIDLTVNRGEVVGVAGLLGSGRSALARVLCGVDRMTEGEIRVGGSVVKINSPRDAIAAGIVLVPEDRRRQGFVADHSVARNIQLPVLKQLSSWSWVRARQARQLADESIARLRVKTASQDSPIRTLSGGNAQKVVIAKWLATKPDVIVLDEPTAGIDIGSKGEIVALIRDLARQGKAVLILSSELAELLAACDRIVVMSNGELVRTITRADLDAACAGATEPVERLQLAERQLQLALQHRAQQYTKPLGRGPHGETSANAADLRLTANEMARLAAQNARAAIVLHYGGNDWSRAQSDGMRDRFAELGVRVVAVTDAGFDATQQVTDIDRVMRERPDVIVSIPTDPAVTADAYRGASKQGARLVFMDNVPDGFTPGTDYVACVSADNYAGGEAAAKLIGEALGGHGEVALIGHDAAFFVTRQRRDGVVAALLRDFPGVKVVEERAVAGPDFVTAAQAATTEVLAAHPRLGAIWAVWDVPAQGVVAALHMAGRGGIKIVTHDLGSEVAANMMGDGPVFGVVAQRCFDQGIAEATLAGYALLNKPAPAYVALPVLLVTRETLPDAWEIVYRQPSPFTSRIQGRAA